MALSEDIVEAVQLFHEGSQFLHDVSTGPSTGAASSVTNPVDMTEQITIARAINELGDVGGFLTLDTIQTATGKKTFAGGLDKTTSAPALLNMMGDKALVGNVEELQALAVRLQPQKLLWDRVDTSTTGVVFATVLAQTTSGSDAPMPVSIQSSGTGDDGDSIRVQCAQARLGVLNVGYVGTSFGSRYVALNATLSPSTKHTSPGDSFMLLTPWDADEGFDCSDPANVLTFGAAAWGLQFQAQAANQLQARLFAMTSVGVVFGNWVTGIWSPNSQTPMRIICKETAIDDNTNRLECTLNRVAWATDKGSFDSSYKTVPTLDFTKTGTTSSSIIRPTYFYTNKKPSVLMNGTTYLDGFELY